jgi:hypothetical protein
VDAAIHIIDPYIAVDEDAVGDYLVVGELRDRVVSGSEFQSVAFIVRACSRIEVVKRPAIIETDVAVACREIETIVGIVPGPAALIAYVGAGIGDGLETVRQVARGLPVVDRVEIAAVVRVAIDISCVVVRDESDIRIVPSEELVAVSFWRDHIDRAVHVPSGTADVVYGHSLEVHV